MAASRQDSYSSVPNDNCLIALGLASRVQEMSRLSMLNIELLFLSPLTMSADVDLSSEATRGMNDARQVTPEICDRG